MCACMGEGEVKSGIGEMGCVESEGKEEGGGDVVCRNECESVSYTSYSTKG